MSERQSVYSDHAFLGGSGNDSWSILFSLIPPGSRVLDVGCSTGHFGAALQDLKNCSVVGVDVTEADILEARRLLSDARLLDVSVDGALESLGTFDVVVFADVIEHLVDPRGVLRRVHEVLSTDGIVAFSIPNMGHLSVRLDLLEGRFPYRERGLLDRTHLHFYDRSEVQGVFADAGFQILREVPVVSRYPAELVERELERLGLSAHDAFFAMLTNTESHVFQYVGTAGRAVGGASAAHPRAEYVMPQDTIYEFAQAVLAENRAIRGRLPFVVWRKLRRMLRRR